MQFARDVAIGRLQPRSVDPRWNTRRDPPDFVATLQSVAANDVRSLLEAVQPRHPEYGALRNTLATLRTRVGHDVADVPRTRLKVGQWNAAVVPLRQRLAAMGALTQGVSLESTQYDADVERAVKVFQSRHGLPATGVLDHHTIDRLNVPLERRIQQVALNLERWRWLPDDLGARHFIINVPQFHLFAREHGNPVLDMRVVVGKRGMKPRCSAMRWKRWCSARTGTSRKPSRLKKPCPPSSEILSFCLATIWKW
jgi:murein L,D-transpeptidase YcbB/YkuD